MPNTPTNNATPGAVAPATRPPRFEPGRFDAVAIGSSTGGPSVIRDILMGLPADLPTPIFLAQHMPETFTASFSVQLDNACALSVVHAEDGMPVYPGTVYVAVGRKHMRIRRSRAGRQSIQISDSPEELLYKPSADELLGSCAEAYGRATLAVILTGIGRDGSLGAAAVRAAGGMVLAQTEETCAVYGMPKACVQDNAADAQLDPEAIRRTLIQLSPDHHHLAHTP